MDHAPTRAVRAPDGSRRRCSRPTTGSARGSGLFRCSSPALSGAEEQGRWVAAEPHRKRVDRCASLGVFEVGDAELEEPGEDEAQLLVGEFHALFDDGPRRVSHRRGMLGR